MKGVVYRLSRTIYTVCRTKVGGSHSINGRLNKTSRGWSNSGGWNDGPNKEVFQTGKTIVVGGEVGGVETRKVGSVNLSETRVSGTPWHEERISARGG